MDIFLSQGKITYKVLGGDIELYFFTGPSPIDVLRQYTDFVGRPCMPPMWSLGVHQCRWGYDNVTTAMKVVESHKISDLPLDALWLDIEYVSYHDSDFRTLISQLRLLVVTWIDIRCSHTVQADFRKKSFKI